MKFPKEKYFGILDEKKNVIIVNGMSDKRYQKMWLDPGQRRIQVENVGDFRISTFFLGMNHGSEEKPLWFETMIFGEGDLGGYCERCETYTESLVQHKRVLKKAKAYAGRTKIL